MPKTFVDGREVKKWWVDGRQVKKAYLDGRLIYQSEYVLDITTSDHNIAVDWAFSKLPSSVQLDPTQAVRIIVRPNVQLVTANPTIQGAFHFYGLWGNREVIIENHGYIIGRGGTGGNEGAVGAVGGRAIYNESARLTIINRGVIAAGGSGGGGSYLGASYGGGGGAPFAGGGWGSGESGNAASFDVPGAGKSWAGRVSGAGGGWGQGGVTGNGGGASAAGEATRGTINWEVLGDVRGARV